jgi:hypothetical protein
VYCGAPTMLASYIFLSCHLSSSLTARHPPKANASYASYRRAFRHLIVGLQKKHLNGAFDVESIIYFETLLTTEASTQNI